MRNPTGLYSITANPHAGGPAHDYPWDGRSGDYDGRFVVFRAPHELNVMICAWKESNASDNTLAGVIADYFEENPDFFPPGVAEREAAFFRFHFLGDE